MARSKRHKARGQESSAPSSLPFEVDMTASAEEIYKDLYRKARAAENRGDYGSSHCTTFDMVRDAVKRIIPADPFNKKYALRGELSNMFRIRKGRLRICWIASSKMHRVCILFISESLRKEGDAQDPYVILQNMVDAGKFDEIFGQFGVRVQRTRQ
jgi:mRNA-degrading endonuclease RelE of RelBE toxin-antitoxin system